MMSKCNMLNETQGVSPSNIGGSWRIRLLQIITIVSPPPPLLMLHRRLARIEIVPIARIHREQSGAQTAHEGGDDTEGPRGGFDSIVENVFGGEDAREVVPGI
jgi:hypothetical protein